MAKKCYGCNSVYQDDTVLYCPNCGMKVEALEVEQKSESQVQNTQSIVDMVKNLDWMGLYQKLFVEYVLVTLAVIALLWQTVAFSLIISVAVLITPFIDKQREYKCIMLSRILTAINIVICLLAL